MKWELVLKYIGENRGITAYQLAKKIGANYINTFTICKGIEKKGLIKRVKDMTSNRNFKPQKLYLTERGERYLEYLTFPANKDRAEHHQ